VGEQALLQSLGGVAGLRGFVNVLVARWQKTKTSEGSAFYYSLFGQSII